MAFGLSDIVELQIVGQTSAGQFRNVWHYQLTTLPSPTVTAANLGEAWWNHVKGAYRAATAIGFGPVFKTVKCRSMMSATGDAGEFAVPTAEQTGSRATPSGDQAPRFLAAGMRLIVPNRSTRPGQKRIFGMYEFDMNGDGIVNGWETLVLAIATVQLPSIILGAPALSQAMLPVVCRIPPTLPVTVFQPWTSAIVNLNVTTQNSRKFGRGA